MCGMDDPKRWWIWAEEAEIICRDHVNSGMILLVYNWCCKKLYWMSEWYCKGRYMKGNGYKVASFVITSIFFCTWSCEKGEWVYIYSFAFCSWRETYLSVSFAEVNWSVFFFMKFTKLFRNLINSCLLFSKK